MVMDSGDKVHAYMCAWKSDDQKIYSLVEYYKLYNS